MKEKHPLYETWRGMIRRCYNKRSMGFSNYGGRGINVCDRWIEFDGFTNFIADMGDRPSGNHSLDRINNDGNYEPRNCRWATHSEQCRNTRHNRFLTHNGERKTLEEWSVVTGVSKSTLFNRILRGWTDRDVLQKSVQHKGKQNSLFPVGGRSLVIALGLNVSTISSRLRRGWSFEDAIKKAVDSKRGRKLNRHASKNSLSSIMPKTKRAGALVC